MTSRYALYFAPSADTELARFGAAALGRTATSARNATTAKSSHPDLSYWLNATQSAAHYGFHATLKAPFELRQNKQLSELQSQLKNYCDKQRPINLAGLTPRFIGNFTALTLKEEPESLTTLALNIVDIFEPFRKPLSKSDVQRRNPQSLTTRQVALLERYGYPYVAEEFRFHMTLSGSLTSTEHGYLNWLEALYQKYVTTTPQLNQIAIYSQPNRATPFTEMCSYQLTGSNHN